jgi:hypothetical protein
MERTRVCGSVADVKFLAKDHGVIARLVSRLEDFALCSVCALLLNDS